jgi:hypothetical protein
MSSKRKYKSKLETIVGGLLGPSWDYEPFRVPYTTHRHYNPDFVIGDLLVEVKGYFRPGDTAKYTAIRDALTEQELVFYLSSPRAKVRKGGKITMAEWCEKNDIKWFDEVLVLKAYGETK